MSGSPIASLEEAGRSTPEESVGRSSTYAVSSSLSSTAILKSALWRIAATAASDYLAGDLLGEKDGILRPSTIFVSVKFFAAGSKLYFARLSVPFLTSLILNNYCLSY